CWDSGCCSWGIGCETCWTRGCGGGERPSPPRDTKVLPRVTLSGTSRYIIGANVPRPPRRAVAPQRRCQERPAKSSLPEEAPPMKIRRSLVTMLAAAVVGFAGAQELPTVRAAMEAAGTFSWIVHGMDCFGTAEANGIRV